MSSDLQNQFKSIFRQLFDEYTRSGLSKQEAGAKALAEAQSILTSNKTNQQAGAGGGGMSAGAAVGGANTNSSQTPSSGLFSFAPSSIPPDAKISAEKAEKSIDSKIAVVAPTPAPDLVPPVPAPASAAPVVVAPELSVALVRSIIAECKEKNEATSLIRAVGSFFCNDERLMTAFLLSNSMVLDKGEVNEGEEENLTITSDFNLDIGAVQQVYSLLYESGYEGVINSLAHAMETLVSNMQFHSNKYSQPNQLRLFCIVLEHPHLEDSRFEALMRNFTHALNRITNTGKQIFVTWLQSSTIGEDRYLKYIRLIHNYITNRIANDAPDDARMAVRVMAFLKAAQSTYIDVNSSLFYNDSLNEYMQKTEGQRIEFRNWIRDRQQKENELQKTDPLYLVQNEFKSFISYYFILTPHTKSQVLEIDAIVQQRQAHDEEMQEAANRGQQTIQSHRLYFVLHVSRDKMIRDTLDQIPFIEEENFKKELKVVFDGEDGVDAGGVRKEYFMLMTKDLLDPNYGMFKYYEESRMLWFDPDCLEQPSEYELIGVLVGIAIYNAVLMDLHMPTALYKKLKGEKCSLSDLSELQPGLANGLRQLLEFDGDVAETFGQNFELTYEKFGDVVTIALKEGGADILVDNDNREEYVQLYVSHSLETSVKSQFEAFSKGFFKVCGGVAMDMFTSEELELLICGGESLDFNDLEEGTTYQDGYEKNSPTTLLLWEVLHEFDDTEKRQFLTFISGSDRCPIDGLKHVNLVISKNTDEENRLPSAHTCFNHLLLPAYSTKEVMREKVKFAMTQTEGFGLR